MLKKEILEASKPVLEKLGYTILADKKTDFVDYFAEKDGTKFSVVAIRPGNANKGVTEFDVKKGVLSALMDNFTPLFVTEEAVSNEIKGCFQFAVFVSLND